MEEEKSCNTSLEDIASEMSEIETSLQDARIRLYNLHLEMDKIEQGVQKASRDYLLLNADPDKPEKEKVAFAVHREKQGMELKLEEMECEAYLNDLMEDVKSFIGHVGPECGLAVREELKPTTESNRVFEKWRDAFEKLNDRWRDQKLKKPRLLFKIKAVGGDFRRLEILYENTLRTMKEAESVLDKVQKFVKVPIDHKEQNIEVYKAWHPPQLDLSKITPGCSLFEWLKEIQRFVNKEKFPDELIMLKTWKSMENHAGDVRKKLMTKNVRNFRALEDQLVATYGYPLIISEQLRIYHENAGKIPTMEEDSPLVETAMEIRSIAEDHVFGIEAGIAQLDYYISNFGAKFGTQKMEQGYLSSSSLFGLAKMLPDTKMSTAVSEMLSMDSVGKLKYLKEEFEGLERAYRETIKVYGANYVYEDVEDAVSDDYAAQYPCGMDD